MITELIKFIRDYGPQADWTSDEILERDLKWYLQSGRAVVLRDKGHLTGLVLYHTVNTTLFKQKNEWPKDVEDGKILYVPLVVVHPLHHSVRMLRGLLNYAKSVHPKLEYLYFERGNNMFSKPYVLPLVRKTKKKKGVIKNGKV